MRLDKFDFVSVPDGSGPLVFQHCVGDVVADRMRSEHRVWESRLYEYAWHNWLTPDSIVMEAGALFGGGAVWLSRRVKHVYAVEAAQLPHRLLCSNLVRNGATNVTPIWAAMWDSTGVPLYCRMADSNLGSTEFAPRTDSHQKFEALSLTLDDLDLPRLDWIDIDIEGAELRMLEGARGTLLRLHPILTVECHAAAHSQHIDPVQANVTRDMVREFLKPWGYIEKKDLWLHVPGQWGD